MLGDKQSPPSAIEERPGSQLLACLSQLKASATGSDATEDCQRDSESPVGRRNTSSTPTIGPSKDDDGLTENTNERLWKRRRRIQFITLCWTFFFEGWSDASLGPLLPSIQEYYRVKYSIVSLIFFFLCIGYIFGAIANVYIVHRFDFGKTILLGSAGQIIGYAMLIPALPFPVTICAYTLYGFFRMMENSQVNAFIVGLNDPSKMGVLQAIYGTGALISPFVATRFATPEHWNFYYFTSLGLALSVAISLVAVFKLKKRDDLYLSSGVSVPAQTAASNERNIYRQLSGIHALYFLSFFSFAYIGVEITIGGWTVTYLMQRTGVGPSAGFVSSGFFGGLALGRVLLLWVNKKVGERRVTILYGVIAIALEIVIWVIPHFITSAILISFVGLLMGPMFPILMNQCGSFFPSHLLSGGIGAIVGFGTLGGALVPFVTGVLADRFGIRSMQPLLLGRESSPVVHLFDFRAAIIMSRFTSFSRCCKTLDTISDTVCEYIGN